MNTDQIKGSIKDTAGKIQEKVGQATDNQHQVDKGAQKQGEAKVDKVVGGVKDVFNK
ncbi:hypothetical protein SAMN06265795_103318 [Noviherbaspirillum humi]|uniref:CsbD-like n=1 Tax=Noviherbaspirillum humi TaxID=1688639 RepID=A0A239FE99_9BURK|nr:CsbD family protein [Noviherbaspirillum humi]SNS55137.1 hypothetical protein SAMN06265795_103318 [Noviherbaspirillum humi]